jgi:hypothetical protein
MNSPPSNRIKNFQLTSNQLKTYLECFSFFNHQLYFNTHNICFKKSLFNQCVIYFLQSMSWQKSMKMYNCEFNRSILNYLSKSPITFKQCIFRDSRILINSPYKLFFNNCSLFNLQICFNRVDSKTMILDSQGEINIIDIYINDCIISNSLFHTSFPSNIHIINCNFMCPIEDPSLIIPLYQIEKFDIDKKTLMNLIPILFVEYFNRDIWNIILNYLYF